MNDLIESLKVGICYVTYEKIDTKELREMECTLNPALIPGGAVINQSAAGSDLVVWCLDKAAWRSFRVNTMKNWRTK